LNQIDGKAQCQENKKQSIRVLSVMRRQKAPRFSNTANGSIFEGRLKEAYLLVDVRKEKRIWTQHAVLTVKAGRTSLKGTRKEC